MTRRLVLLLLFTLTACPPPPQGTVGGIDVWHYDDEDAGVRCYAADNHRFSCVKVRP